jgi:hypothetical protein
MVQAVGFSLIVHSLQVLSLPQDVVLLFDIGLLISEVLFVSTLYLPAYISIYRSNVIYCDISAGSGRTPRGSFQIVSCYNMIFRI